jgi:hypothetical protein
MSLILKPISVMMVIAATAVLSDTLLPLVSQYPSNAQLSANQEPLPPRIQFVSVPASKLQVGMTKAEVESILLGTPKVTSWVDRGTNWQTLDFPGLVPTKVILKDGEVSSISLDVFRADEAGLPMFYRRAWLGMHILAAGWTLGAPSEVRHHTFIGIQLDQLIYQRAGEPEVSIFFVGSRVIARGTGRNIPPRIFQVDLPLPPDLEGAKRIQFAHLGMKESDVRALYGAGKLRVDYLFNGTSASHNIVGARAGNSYAKLTFVEGTLTEIEDLGTLSNAIFQAG